MGRKRKVTQKKVAGAALTGTSRAEATAAAKHVDRPSHSDAKDSAADVSWDDDSWKPGTPLPVQSLSISHELASNRSQGPAASWEEDKGSSDRNLVFYGPPVCYHCGDRGHTGSGCSTPFCMSCDVWGHAKGHCGDACERCGRVHERRDGVCRTFHCQICGLFGHRATQCPGCLCDACGCYGHSSNRCPSSRTCPLCGELGHPQTSCPLLCSRCGYPGHKTDDCMLKQCDKCSIFGHVAAECLFNSGTTAGAEEARSQTASEEALATTAATPAPALSSWHPSEAYAYECKSGTPSLQPPAATAAETACSNGRPGSLTAPHMARLAAAETTPAVHQSAVVGQMAAAHLVQPAMLKMPVAVAQCVQPTVLNPVNTAAVTVQPGARPSARGPPPGFQPRPLAGLNALAVPDSHPAARQQQMPVPFPGRLLHLPPGPLQLYQQQTHAQQAPSTCPFEPPPPAAGLKRESPEEDEEFEEMLGLLGV